MQTHGGKGSTPRPVNKEKFDANWGIIFGDKKHEHKVDSVVEGEVQSATASENRLGRNDVMIEFEAALNEAMLEKLDAD